MQMLKCLRHVVCYSTSTFNKGKTRSMSPVFANYLISLGLSREEADLITAEIAHSWQSKKRKDNKDDPAAVDGDFHRTWRNRGAKNVSDFNFVANADSVVSYLKHRGFRESHIRIIVSNSPRILVFKVSSTVKPKVEFFLNLGLSIRELTWFVNGNPSVFHVGMKSTIVPSLRLLKEVLGSTTDLISFINDSSIWYDGFPKVSKVFVPNIILLKDRGIPLEFIREWLKDRSLSFILHDVKSFKNAVDMVDQHLGIPRDSKMFMKAVFMCCYSKPLNTPNSFKPILKRFGWPEKHAEDLFKNYPLCLWRSEDTFTEKLDFLKNELGCDDHNYLASTPILFQCDLKTKLRPRHEVFQLLKEKGLISINQDFCRALRMSKTDFENRFVVPYQDVHQVYFQFFR